MEKARGGGPPFILKVIVLYCLYDPCSTGGYINGTFIDQNRDPPYFGQYSPIILKVPVGVNNNLLAPEMK